MDELTILAYLAKLVKEKPDYELYHFIEEDEVIKIISPSDLDCMAKKIAAELQLYDCYQKPVIILYAPGYEYIYAFFACLYAGAIPVPAYPPLTEEMARTLAKIIENSNAALLLTNQKINAKLKKINFFAPLIPFFKLGVSTDILQVAEKVKKLTIINSSKINKASDFYNNTTVLADDIAYLQYTSGSTKAPKGVAISHKNLMANLQQLTEQSHINAEDILVSWLPPYHDMGLISGILLPVFLGFKAIHFSPISFLQKPVRWLELISKYKGTVAGGPDFAYRMCVNKIKEDELEGVNLSSWRLAFCGAETIHPNTLKHFSEKFAPYSFNKDIFIPCYGLAEAVVYICSPNIQTKHLLYKEFNQHKLRKEHIALSNHLSPDEGQTMVSVGRCPSTSHVLIVDPESCMPLKEGEVGEIWFHGPNAAAFYWNNAEASKELLQAKLAGAGDVSLSYVRTGDLGFKYNEELFVTGRIKDLIIINGFNHYAEDIEFSLREQLTNNLIGSIAAFSIPAKPYGEDLVILIEIKDNPSDEHKTFGQLVREIIIASHFISPKEVLFVPAKTLPKTTSGKLKRMQCRHDYLNNNFPYLGQY